jgi:hypothetical protein
MEAIGTDITEILIAGASGSVTSAERVLNHSMRALTACQGSGFIDLAFAAETRIITCLSSNVFGKARGGPMVDDDFTHLLFHESPIYLQESVELT